MKSWADAIGTDFEFIGSLGFNKPLLCAASSFWQTFEFTRQGIKLPSRCGNERQWLRFDCLSLLRSLSSTFSWSSWSPISQQDSRGALNWTSSSAVYCSAARIAPTRRRDDPAAVGIGKFVVARRPLSHASDAAVVPSTPPVGWLFVLPFKTLAWGACGVRVCTQKKPNKDTNMYFLFHILQATFSQIFKKWSFKQILCFQKCFQIRASKQSLKQGGIEREQESFFDRYFVELFFQGACPPPCWERCTHPTRTTGITRRTSLRDTYPRKFFSRLFSQSLQREIAPEKTSLFSLWVLTILKTNPSRTFDGYNFI